MTLQTSYEFTLPRGYVDHNDQVQRHGRMRLATARDELEPLRHPTVSDANDPRLTILVLARVVEELGDLDRVTEHEIEGLFAVDLAFLQDFYGVINFGSQEEYDALLAAQGQANLLGDERAPRSSGDAHDSVEASSEAGGADADSSGDVSGAARRSGLRHAVEELPRTAG